MNKLIPTLTTVLLLGASLSNAATGFYDGLYVILDKGAGNLYYQVTSGTTPGSGAASGHSLTSDGVNPTFTNLGTFDLTTSDSLTLKGFEYKTYENDSSDVSHGNLFWNVYEVDTLPGTFNQITDANNNDDTWTVTTQNHDLLAGLTAGKNYNLRVYTESYTNGTNTAGNIFGFTGDDPIATFSVIPETSSLVMLGLTGLAAGLVLRKRKRA